MNKLSHQMRHLIEGIKHKDEKSFKLLYDTYYRLVYFVIIKIVHNKQDAEELSQDTFVKIYNTIESFEGENFQSWIYTIAKNTALNFYNRTLKKRAHIISNEALVQNAKTEDYAISPLHEMLLKNFSVETADIIISKAVFDFSFDHIANMMQLSKSYVYKNYTSSIERLKFLMEGKI
jgi:RNA polymerase sigma-70 factor (ECF subfamily)